jgi:hypothetical protein
MSLNPDTVIQTTQLILEVEAATPALDLSVLTENGDGHHKTSTSAALIETRILS